MNLQLLMYDWMGSVKLQTKFSLGIITVFSLLAIGIAITCVQWINKNTIREAENRVGVHIKAAWTIHNSKISGIHSALEILSKKQEIKDLLLNKENQLLLIKNKKYLEAVRKEKNMDILNLMDSKGKVILRTRPPYNKGDTLSEDPMVKKTTLTKKCSKKNMIFSSERLLIEGNGLIDRCLKFGGEPRGMLIGTAIPVISDKNFIGIIQMGKLLNGATEEVDKIREGVFENKLYEGKPLGTTTIFMGDLRISTNVLNNKGRRAIGTRVSNEVAEHVLKKGLSWTGRAWVVNAWYLSQYDPIKDPDGNIIGMLYLGELEQKYLDMRTQAVISYLSVIFSGMILAFLIFFAITRSILKPIQKLSHATEMLSRNDLSHRITVHSKDEVGSLSNSFNHMAEKLQKQQKEIQLHQKTLEHTNKELQTINSNYMEMLGFVSHELKNPLSSAILGLYTVKDGYLGELNISQKKGLESVAQSLEYFNDMIKNYLDLSRLEKGELRVKKKNFLLHNEVIAPLLKELGREFQEKRMKVENNIHDEILLNADRDLIMIVYDNLLSNAIKYGKESGRIVLDFNEGENEITLSVYNEGAGIPEKKMAMLFEKFSRIDTPEYAGKKGTGLGLFVCREIIEKQGGKIWAESKAGKWIRFIFTLPNKQRRKK